METCARCLEDADVTIVSFFNTETICLACRKREREHPRYAAACDAECSAVLAGDYNYPGIGAPPELYTRNR